MLFERAAVAGEQAKENEYSPGDGYLAKVNIEIRNGIKITPGEKISQQEAGQQYIGGGIGPENGKIGNEQNPGGQKSVVAA